MAPRARMDSFGLTDIGRQREINEDQFLIADLTKSAAIRQSSMGLEIDPASREEQPAGQLLVVADGMGGHAAGEIASALVTKTLVESIVLEKGKSSLLELPDEELIEQLQATLQRCQEAILEESKAVPERRGMGTTLTMAFVVGMKVFVVHVGDSRCYLYRTGELEQVTTDHTIAQQLVESGKLAPEEARDSHWSHLLVNALGGSEDILSPEVQWADLEDGDVLLLCTDGLTQHLTDAEILKVLDGEKSIEKACQQLVRAANDGGGTDNITAVVARFELVAS
ncbi:MAG: protein phosphatase 2C domain-containing protein [Planctomycetota bacterium]